MSNNPYEMKRFNIRASLELHDWLKDQADQLGVPLAPFIVTILNEYRKQTISVEMVSQAGFQDLLKQKLLESKLGTM